MTAPAEARPYRAYVLDVSYFSGKLEAYLRYARRGSGGRREMPAWVRRSYERVEEEEEAGREGGETSN